jgi:hypothetical protein
MMDLKIVVVSWNNRDTLPRCLSSLEKACDGISWKAVVIDNASTDGTREWLKEKGMGHGVWGMVLNEDNRGFARACNQGLSGEDARYYLLLNPDTECPPEALTRLVHEADKYPDAGIFGPKLVNEDGSAQTSLRRYPQWMDQAGVLLKLHNFFPNAPAFRRYFAKDRDLNIEQSVEQVMGACFLIRRDVLEQLGGLDERYFVWFEEVDYCKMTTEAGWKIRYLPSVKVNHLGGHSFAQVFSVAKQRMFNKSLVSYFRKWHPCWRAESLAMVSKISIGLAWFVEKIGMAGKGSNAVLKRAEGRSEKREARSEAFDLRTYGPTDLRTYFLLILAIEFASGLTIFNNVWNSIAVIIASTLMAFVAWKKPALGLSVLLLELVIGSKGALLQLGGWPGTSLRICFFVAFFIGWFGSFIQAKSIKSLKDIMLAHWEWIVMAIILVYAGLRGLALHQEYFLKDANEWIFLALIIPVFDIAKRHGSELFRYASGALIAGIIWIGMKTLMLEYFFAHAFRISPEVYLWVRRTGVGEVTLVSANAFRLFFQSHVYEMVGLIGAVSYLLRDARGEMREARLCRRVAYFVLIASMVALGISLSRSIWMGTVAGILVLAICYAKDLLKRWKAILAIFASGIVSLVLIFSAIAFPIPRVDYANLKDVFGSRISTGDPASVSRWNLLKVVESKIKEAPILGSGFGASITYASKDPRVLKDHPDGMYTTYAFEWGWFEHWIKFGLFGFLFMIFLVFRIGLRAWKSDAEPWLRYAMVATLVGLSVVHIFTPYLNHPLGFGILLMIEGVGIVVRLPTGQAGAPCDLRPSHRCTPNADP